MSELLLELLGELATPKDHRFILETIAQVARASLGTPREVKFLELIEYDTQYLSQIRENSPYETLYTMYLKIKPIHYRTMYTEVFRARRGSGDSFKEVVEKAFDTFVGLKQWFSRSEALAHARMWDELRLFKSDVDVPGELLGYWPRAEWQGQIPVVGFSKAGYRLWASSWAEYCLHYTRDNSNDFESLVEYQPDIHLNQPVKDTEHLSFQAVVRWFNEHRFAMDIHAPDDILRKLERYPDPQQVFLQYLAEEQQKGT